MKKISFILKVLIHFIYVQITGIFGMKHKYSLSFEREDDGKWYVVLPDWPFKHANLQMVAGADDLCEYLSDSEKANITVITSNKELRGYDEYIRCDRVWSYLKYGGQYYIPEFNLVPVKELWLCQVTLFVVGWWPKYLYVRKNK